MCVNVDALDKSEDAHVLDIGHVFASGFGIPVPPSICVYK